jgi:hypothetical protein
MAMPEDFSRRRGNVGNYHGTPVYVVERDEYKPTERDDKAFLVIKNGSYGDMYLVYKNRIIGECTRYGQVTEFNNFLPWFDSKEPSEEVKEEKLEKTKAHKVVKEPEPSYEVEINFEKMMAPIDDFLKWAGERDI